MHRFRAAVLTTALVVAVAVAAPLPAVAASSYLDAGFGTDGISQRVAANVDAPLEVNVTGSALTPQGGVVFAGMYEPGGGCANSRWWVARFTASGQPDPTFGNGTGAVLFVPPGLSMCTTQFTSAARLVAVAVQPGGEVLLGGSPNFVLKRLTPAGDVDTGFAARTFGAATTNGTCFSDHDVTGGRIHDLVVAPSGRIYAAGSRARVVGPSGQGCPGRYAQGPAVVGYEADGSAGAELTAPWGTSTADKYAVKLALLADETPVAVAGPNAYWLGTIQAKLSGAITLVNSPENVVGLAVDSLDRVSTAVLANDYYTLDLRRFGPAGPDASFGDNGAVLTTAVGRAGGLAVDAADRLMVSGIGDLALDLRVARFTSSGALDASFGTAGVRSDRPVRSIAPRAVSPVDVFLGPDGILVPATDARDAFVLARYGPTGTPDVTLDGDGFSFAANPSTQNVAPEGDLQDLVTAGSGATFAVLGNDVVKWRADGSLDSGFGAGGTLRPPAGAYYFYATVDRTGRLLVAGTDGDAGFVGRFDAETGSADQTFGDGGYVAWSRTAVTAIAVDSTGRVLAGLVANLGQGASLARLDDDGHPDASFGSDGTAPTAVTAQRLAIDAQDRIVIAGFDQHTFSIAAERVSADGSPDTSFTRTDLAWYPGQVLVDGAGRIVVLAPDAEQAVRLLPNGGPDAGFAGGTWARPADLEHAMADLGADGRLVIAGNAAGTTDAVVVRYSVDGTVDTAFASGGRARIRLSLPAGLVVAYGQQVRPVIDGSGRVTVGVQAQRMPGYTDRVFSLARFVAAPASDTSGPTVTITTPANGATYDVSETVTASYACADTESGVDSCAGPVVSGAPVTLTPGPGEFTVSSVDLAGNPASTTVHHVVVDGAADTTAPTTAIVQPAEGASFSLGQPVNADYSCSDDGGSGLASCVGSAPAGAPVDTSVEGSFTFTVTATDGAGNTSQRQTHFTVLAGSVSASATGPAILTTDPGGVGASAAVPVQTSIAVPGGSAGSYSVQSQPAGPAPTGFVLFSRQLSISGPAASGPAAPYVVTFAVDASEVGTLTPGQVEVFRNAVLVPACASGTDAAPDPCVADRRFAGGGDVEVSVRTTQFSTWTLGRRAFVASSASPATAGQGSASTVSVRGYGFQPGVTVKVSGTGVTAGTAVRRSATLVEVPLTVGGGATVGPRDLVVTNPGVPAVRCLACFSVSAKPSITAVSPKSRPQGADHVQVVVTGGSFQPGATATLSGDGITVHRVTVVDAGRLDLDVSVSSAATVGARALVVTNPDGGSASKASALSVSTPPVVSTATPSHLRQGTTVSVALNGSGFPADFVAGGGAVSFGAGVDVQSVVRNSASKLTVTVVTASGAAAGQRVVRVTNPDGGTGECVGCADVVVDPQVTSLAPAALSRGASQATVVVHGSGFRPGAIVKLGAGSTVESTSVTDDHTLSLVVTVGGSAALGTRDVTVTNVDTGTTRCIACFTINARPTITSVSPASVPRGAVGQTVQVVGTGFQQGLTVSLSGAGVTATVVAFTATQVTLRVTVAAGAATGARSLTVTNPDGGLVVKATALKIT